MNATRTLRCRHAFETVCLHANGDVVCSIIDGRGDFVVGNVIRVVWQYVVFRWNDRDDQLRRAIAMAEEAGIPIHFDFAHTWGRSRRRPEELRYLTPYLRPFTALPGEPRQGGW